MTTINDYPKSSCQCYNCEFKTYNPPENGVPSNFSVSGCDVPKFFNCYDEQFLRTAPVPKRQSGYKIISKGTNQSFAKDFQKVRCKDDECKTVYASQDPRLVDVRRGIMMTLDRPPQDDGVKLKDVYNENLRGYGTGYRTYSDITAGQITYYDDKSISEPFFTPLFENKARMVSTLYQDPMSAMKPQYKRIPLEKNKCHDTKDRTFSKGLSWIQDSNETREDLMSLQMRKHNEQRWSPRWEN